jgi:GNAT superfamily N-acetyltransferase
MSKVMKIARYEPGMAEDLVEIFNRAVANVPHCFHVDEETFSEELLPAGGGKSTRKRLHSEAGFVARSGESINGFSHVAVEDPKKEGDPKLGAIRFLWYRPGDRATGQKLLDASQEYLTDLGLNRILAFDQDYRYPFFGFKHSYLSDHLGQVQALLWMNGYERVKGEVFLDWPNFEPVDPPEPEVEIDIELEWKKGRGELPGLVLTASRGGKQIGVCECVSCGEFSKVKEVQNWAFTEWIGVEKEHQGRGLGRYLLRRALQEMHGIGYRNAGISTDWKNYRAFVFYTNFGYHVVDWTHAYGLEVDR